MFPIFSLYVVSLIYLLTSFFSLCGRSGFCLIRTCFLLVKWHVVLTTNYWEKIVSRETVSRHAWDCLGKDKGSVGWQKCTNKLICLNCLKDDWCSRFLYFPSLPASPSSSLINMCLCLCFWSTPIGHDWFSLNKGSVVLYLIMYWQSISCPAASIASCHKIESVCVIGCSTKTA